MGRIDKIIAKHKKLAKKMEVAVQHERAVVLKDIKEKIMIKELKPFDMISMQIVNRIIVVAWNLQQSDKIQSGIFVSEMKTYELDEYKSKLKEINCADFNGLEKKVPKQNLLLDLSFLRDSNSGDAMSKLGSYESRLLNRFSKLREELNIYKEQHGKR